MNWLERRCENLECPKRHPRLAKTPTIIDNSKFVIEPSILWTSNYAFSKKNLELIISIHFRDFCYQELPDVQAIMLLSVLVNVATKIVILISWTFLHIMNMSKYQ